MFFKISWLDGIETYFLFVPIPHSYGGITIMGGSDTNLEVLMPLSRDIAKNKISKREGF